MIASIDASTFAAFAYFCIFYILLLIFLIYFLLREKEIIYYDIIVLIHDLDFSFDFIK